MQTNQDQELVQIIKSDNAGELKQRIEAGLSPDAKTQVLAGAPEPMIMLDFAVLTGAREVAALLVKSGAKLNGGKFKPLILAVLGNHMQNVKLLLDGGADPNVKNNDGGDRGLTALMYAVSPPRGPELIELLLARGADPHLVTKKGETALSRAIAYGNAPAATRLLQAGCKPDGTLLLRPIYSGDLDLIRAFITAGADVNVTGIWSQKNGRFWTDAPVNCTLLDGAVSERTSKVELLRNLLPAERAKHGTRHQSQADLYFTMIQELIRAGADVNKIGTSAPPLYWATDAGDLETVKLLLQSGANPNLAQDLPRNMPLHRACCGGYVEIVECLLKSGADVKMANEEGRTALEELRPLKKTHQIDIWEKAIQQGTKVEPEMLETLYVEWNKNRTRLIEMLKKIPGSERKGSPSNVEHKLRNED